MRMLLRACVIALFAGGCFLSGGYDEGLSVVATGPSEVTGVWISPTRSFVACATAGGDPKLLLYDDDLHEVSSLGASPGSVAFSPSGEMLFISDHPYWSILTIPALRVLVTAKEAGGLPRIAPASYDVACAPGDGKWVISCSPWNAKGADLAVVDGGDLGVIYSRRVLELDGRSRRTVVSGHGLNSVVVVSGRSCLLFQPDLAGSVTPIPLSLDTRYSTEVAAGPGLVVACGRNGELCGVDVRQRKVAFSLVVRPGCRADIAGGGDGGVFAIAWQHNEGPHLHDTTLQVWRLTVETQELLHEATFDISGPTGTVKQIAINEKKGYVLLAAGKLYVWRFDDRSD